VRRRLMAIIGVAFCAGALTALWAARPWSDPVEQRALAISDRPARGDSPTGSVGTYGETGGRGAESGTAADPWARAPSGSSPSDAGNSIGGEPEGGPRSVAPRDTAAEAELLDRDLAMPVAGIDPGTLQPTFHSPRGGRTHEALDILATKGAPVVAVDDGEIVKLFYSERGGNTIYQFDPPQRYCYYYAHLDRYARGLAEGQHVKRGEVIGYVGSTGNASPDAPHLHFAIFRLGPGRRWWEGTPIDPYPVLAALRAGSTR
jgi:peptidoglycan LD-endopeptidase LytH